MSKKINLGPLYIEIRNSITPSISPQEFQNKIQMHGINKTTLKHWLQANDFEFIYFAVVEQNEALMLYFLQELAVFSKKILFLRGYEFLRTSIEHINPKIFNFLFKRLSMDEEHHFLAKNGINLYQKSFAQNKPHILRKLFTIDSLNILKYLSHQPKTIMTQICKHQGAEFLDIIFAAAPREAYFEFLKSHHNIYLKQLISSNQPELVRHLFRHYPHFFEDLNEAERLDIFAFIAVHASKECFQALSYFIQAQHLNEIYKHINPVLINMLILNEQSHILEFLLLGTGNIAEFNLIYQALKTIRSDEAQQLHHRYKPIAQVYDFLDGLLKNQTRIPDEIEQLTDVYPFVNKIKQFAIMRLLINHNPLHHEYLIFFEHSLDLIAKSKIKLLASDDNHPIHPFFPAVINYYLPILKHIKSNHPLQTKFLLNFSINLIENLDDIQYKDLHLFSNNMDFLSRFVTQIIHCRSHKIYKSLEHKPEECTMISPIL